MSLFDLFTSPVNGYAVPVAVTAISVMLLGCAVVARERASLLSLRFFLVTLSIGIWLGAFAMMYGTRDAGEALGWAKAAYLGVPFIPIAIYHFTLSVLRGPKSHTSFPLVCWAISGSFAVCVLKTDALVSSVHQYWWGYYPQYGWLSAPYLVFFFGLMALSLWRYWTQFQVTKSGDARERIRWLMVAFGIASLGSIDYLAKYGLAVYPFGYLPVMGMVMIAALAIWRYRLIDITPAFAANQIIETMGDALFVLDDEDRFQVVNQAACLMFRRSESLLIGRRLSDVNPALSERLQAYQQSGANALQDQRVSWTDPDGHRMTVSLSSSVTMGESGRPAALICIARDVTKRQQADEERDRFFHLSLDLLCVAGSDGYFKQVNPAWERTTGYTPSELMRRPYIEFVHPDDRRATVEASLRLIEAGDRVVSFENRYRCKDGSYRWLLWNAAPVPDAGLIYAAAHDITQRKHAEEQLLRAHEELRASHDALKAAQMQLIDSAKMESVGMLAAGVAHEVKNPLAIIVMGVEYLRRHLAESRNGVGVVLQDIGNAVRRADTVIRGLLDFSTARQLELRPEPVDRVVDQALLLVKHALDRAHIQVVRRMSGPVPAVPLDQQKMEQVFVNLLMNAIDAMTSGGQLIVTTSLRTIRPGEIERSLGSRSTDRFHPGDRVIVVDIDDQGTGISPEALRNLFDPFFTTKPTGQGTGLGLAVSRAIVDLHGGLIRLANRAGGGVRATVMLKVEGGES